MTRVLRNHPTFEAAPSAERWTGGLRELWAALELRATKAPMRWHRFVLPHGATVAMRRGHDGRLRVAISRAAKNPSRDAWRNEIATFRKYFAIEAWSLETEKFDRQVQGQVFVEPMESPVVEAQECRCRRTSVVACSRGPGGCQPFSLVDSSGCPIHGGEKPQPDNSPSLKGEE
ncbi:MAG: hypothetical protein ABR575_00265 [Actinomycetota bacterium]